MIYLDHNATTATRPEVVDAMRPYLTGLAGNASSRHAQGRLARQAIDRARRRIVTALQADGATVLFTSGATEANNLAVAGAVPRQASEGDTVWLSPIDHPSTVEPTRALSRRGYEVRMLPADAVGKVCLPTAHEKMLPPRLAVIQVASGETGTIQDVARLRGDLPPSVRFHADAVQAIGKIPIGFHALGVSSLSLSGHKLGGPQGIGALLLRKDTSLSAVMHGGHQQGGMRPGTEPVAAIVGLGEAVALAVEQLAETSRRLAALRDRLETGLRRAFPAAVVNGDASHRLPTTCNISFLSVKAESLVMALDLAGVCCSAGSACASGSLEPSPALVAMGLTGARLLSAIRFSVGWTTTEEEIDDAIVRITKTVRRLSDTPSSAAEPKPISHELLLP